MFPTLSKQPLQIFLVVISSMCFLKTLYYVVVDYVDNDAQQPKECFQNTEVDLKTGCRRILLELLGHSDSLCVYVCI